MKPCFPNKLIAYATEEAKEWLMFYSFALYPQRSHHSAKFAPNECFAKHPTC